MLLQVSHVVYIFQIGWICTLMVLISTQYPVPTLLNQKRFCIIQILYNLYNTKSFLIQDCWKRILCTYEDHQRTNPADLKDINNVRYLQPINNLHSRINQWASIERPANHILAFRIILFSWICTLKIPNL